MSTTLGWRGAEQTRTHHRVLVCERERLRDGLLRAHVVVLGLAVLLELFLVLHMLPGHHRDGLRRGLRVGVAAWPEDLDLREREFERTDPLVAALG